MVKRYIFYVIRCLYNLSCNIAIISKTEQNPGKTTKISLGKKYCWIFKTGVNKIQARLQITVLKSYTA